MTKAEVFMLGSAAFLLGLSLICANLLLLRKTHRRVYLPLALFFVAEALNCCLTIFSAANGPETAPVLVKLANAITVPIAMTQAPLFWLYVRALTSEDDEERVRYKMLHLLPFFAATVFVWLYLNLPMALIEGAGIDMITPWIQFLILSVYAVLVLFYVQVATYLVITIRLLVTYNSRLKDLFASTESRELNWVWWIALVGAAFWVFNVAVLLLKLVGLWDWATPAINPEVVNQVISGSLIWVIALWGLRQNPGLLREIDEGDRAELQASKETAKYKNSALTSDHAKRIAAKIERAMVRDLLYRDPNLSLWDLAKHIGATSNYVSQTLNETLGESFFDYVNRWRIKDAVQQMDTSDETVLVLAYDVGFNSRSSFYKAFRRETGMTPSQFRRHPTRSTAASGSAEIHDFSPRRPVVHE
ncbi:helix-turn-helix transcriptional regulator [uncultured Roseobacter sp.]|uniref:helix-turn-helix domain-containing protein n=1 Tax=uncultured Roseobacter sp. TaxID=114847 RepID=UPI0026035029|nr:helix-turn-helix transcriptional regulator [uncultured Roseobacter sp.]